MQRQSVNQCLQFIESFNVVFSRGVLCIALPCDNSVPQTTKIKLAGNQEHENETLSEHFGTSETDEDAFYRFKV